MAFHPFMSGFANLMGGSWSELTASLRGRSQVRECAGAGWLGRETDHRAISGPSTLQRAWGSPKACGSAGTPARRCGSRSLAALLLRALAEAECARQDAWAAEALTARGLTLLQSGTLS